MNNEVQIITLLFNTLGQYWALLMSTYLFAAPVFIAIVYMIMILVQKGRNK